MEKQPKPSRSPKEPKPPQRPSHDRVIDEIDRWANSPGLQPPK